MAHKRATPRGSGVDRAKASEHAILMSRELPIPARTLTSLLPRVARRLAGKLWLTVPTTSTTSTDLPVKLVLSASRDVADLPFELKLSSLTSAHDFFEGNLRFDDRFPDPTQILLIGRFTFPQDEFQKDLDENAMRAIAENNVARIFERLLHEIEAPDSALS